MLIQHELTEVRYQLESYESRKRTYDSRIQYSSIEMTVREVERETKVSDSFGAQLKERLIGNLYDVKEGFRSLALMADRWAAVLDFVGNHGGSRCLYCQKKLRKQNEKSDEPAAVHAAEYSAGTSAKSGLPEFGKQRKQASKKIRNDKNYRASE